MALSRSTYTAYLSLLRHELVPALGCTEPIAIALAAAKAREVLNQMPSQLHVKCSGNVIKNVKSVTVPNSGGLCGIDVAATLGVIGGKSELDLEVLRDIDDTQIHRTKLLLQSGFCAVDLAEGKEGLFIAVQAIHGTEEVLVEIEGSHTNITRILKNGETLLEGNQLVVGEDEIQAYKEMLDIQTILEFADHVEISDVEQVIQRQIDLNSAIADEGLRGDWGIRVGKTMLKYSKEQDVKIRATARAAAGSDARMGGCSLPVVINSGSGNQGMTVSLPVIEYAEELGVSRPTMIRALVLANLIALLQKRYIGNLSAFCGAVSAAGGAASGIAYLYGGSYDEISNTITNTLANVGGIVCDGAKPSCAAKIASSLDAAILAFLLGAKEGRRFRSGDGLVKENAEKTIESVGRMGREGMRSTDIEILNIMMET